MRFAVRIKLSPCIFFCSFPSAAASRLLSPKCSPAVRLKTIYYGSRGKTKKARSPLKAICARPLLPCRTSAFGAEETSDHIPSDRKGCLAGLHMCFVTHKGDVYPCGYLPLSAGNIRERIFPRYLA